MSNLITDLTARIENYRIDNQNPCKNYATEAAAEKATLKMAHAATYFDARGRKDVPSATYVVFYVEAWGRWVGCIDLGNLLRRPDTTGGYMGFCKDFFTY